MKKSIIFSLFILLAACIYSCKLSQETVQTYVTDLQSKATLKEGDILLNKKAKIAILNNTHYGNELIDNSAFRLQRDGRINFKDMGSSSSHLKVDTMLCSNILANTTTIELRQTLNGDIFLVELPKENYTDNKGNILLPLIKEHYHPDFLIILTKQCFRIKGDAYNIGFQTHEIIGSDQYMTGIKNRRSGEILIDYENEWKILNLKEPVQERNISQRKVLKSSFSNLNDLTIQLFECARLSSKDFATLFSLK